MPCYHPIEAWDYSPEQLNFLDKRNILFREPPMELRQEMIRQGRRLLLPCRHCVGCRLSKSREWANRVVMEQLYHEDSWFLTLTYDDEHLPRSFPVDKATGEILSVHSSLVKVDLQKFMKRLRFNSHQSIRFFAAGEYGSITYRPHYHLLLFGLQLSDLEVIRKSPLGDEYYISQLISKCWDKGFHVLGKVTWQSAAYVARYTMKKATHGYDPRYYDAAGIEPEFQVMSNRPGLARQYYDDHPDLFDYQSYNVSTPQGGRKMYPSAYFRRLYSESHPMQAMQQSLKRSSEADVKYHLKLLLTDNDFYDILRVEEEKQIRKLVHLQRNEI